MKCGGGGCIETVRSGDHYYVLDNKDYSLGPLAILSTVEYGERYAKALANYDATRMFEAGEQYETFHEAELDAYTAYITDQSAPLASLEDGESFIAHTDQRGLPVSMDRAASFDDVTGIHQQGFTD